MVKQMFKLAKNASPEDVAAKTEDIRRERERLTARQREIESEIATHYGQENPALMTEYNGNIARLNALVFVEQSLIQELRDANKRNLLVWYERHCISEREAIDGYEELTPKIKEAEEAVAALNQQSVDLQLQRRQGLQARTMGLNERVDQNHAGDRSLLAELDSELADLRAKYKLE